jgi:beta-galactosidase
MNWNVWRAPTDNDRKLKLQWMAAGYDRAVTRAYSTLCEKNNDRVVIRTKASIAPQCLQRFMDLDITWTVFASGAITVSVHGDRNTEFPEMPRFGLRMFLPEDMEQITYCGLGPMENYCDKRHAAYHGVFNTTVTGMHEDYIRPQENGAHGDCDYVSLESDGLRIFAVSSCQFSFNASHYTQEELTRKSHNYELDESGCTILCLDYRHNGIGSNSCGPELLEKYRLDEETIDFSMTIIPESK